jgi:hypothetical protein
LGDRYLSILLDISHLISMFLNHLVVLSASLDLRKGKSDGCTWSSPTDYQSRAGLERGYGSPTPFWGDRVSPGPERVGSNYGDRLVDIPFPKKIRDELVATGRANPHHILPESGWISFYIRNDTDVESAIRLLEESLKLAVKQRARRRTPTTE